MKKSKFILVLLMICLSVFTLALMGCGGDSPAPVDGEVVFEAEGIDLTGLAGHGYSNEASECGMIQGENTKSIRENSKVLKSLSNGYFVGFFTTPDTTLTFNFTADKDSQNNTMKLRLGSEYGSMKLSPSVMAIKVNGEELNYDEITVRGKKLEGLNIVYAEPFRDYEISVPFALQEGDNKIEITILQNKLGIENTAVESVGPGVDCIKVKSDSKLTFESLWESNKEEIQVEK